MSNKKFISFIMGTFFLVSICSIPIQTAENVKTAETIHENTWETIINEAPHNQYAKYGIYVSRTLAVKHPEIYLTADSLFTHVITTHNGFRKAYQIKDVHDMYLMGPSFTLGDHDYGGPPFSFEDVDFSKYTLIKSAEYYPEEYPVFPFLDRRLLPIASTLKPAEPQLTQLEKGVQIYLSREDISYLIYCDNENTYLYTGQDILSVNTLECTEHIDGNPILIFNTDYVWYPVMDRDDTKKDENLQYLVENFATDITIPLLTSFETQMIASLKECTQLSSQHEINMACVFSMRSCGGPVGYFNSDPFRSVEKSGVNIEAERRLFLKYANYLSPITAYLAGITQKCSGKQKLDGLSTEYLKYTVMPTWEYNEAHGHTWFCEFVEQTIDESYTTQAGHCVVQSANLSAVLDITGIDNYWIQSYRYGLHAIFHDWLYMPEYESVIHNGVWSTKGEIRLNKIIFVGFKDTWAYTEGYTVTGSASTEEFIEMLTYLDNAFGKIYIKGSGDTEIPLEKFFTALQEREAAHNFLVTGIENLENNELRDALHNLGVAHEKLSKSYPDYSEVIYTTQDTQFIFLDLEEEVIFLCLKFISGADNAFEENEYEDALYDFTFVFETWSNVYYGLALVMDSEEYQEYAEIGNRYTPQEMEEKIKMCIEKITSEAEELRKKGSLKESKEKYQFMITCLAEAGWNEEEIKDLELKKEDIGAAITARKRVVFGVLMVMVVVVIAGIAVIYKKVKKR
ncbi:MAG: hypothetical protein PVF58_15990 [Candidatus Methanofastidiosia archaeon]